LYLPQVLDKLLGRTGVFGSIARLARKHDVVRAVGTAARKRDNMIEVPALT
jgi:hypothetical protein